MPDPLVGLDLRIDPDLDALLAQAERAVAALGSSTHGDDLVGIARFLLRSEAIASSRIEGIAPSARQIAFAELAQHEQLAGFSAQAALVARNMTLVRDATTVLAGSDRLEVELLEALHRALLADEPSHHGVRKVQNWIGGSDWHPLGAAFVPPHPSLVRDQLEDLLQYMKGAAHAPIVQAAIAHAQFETIHPFTDGNGRVGRALIHTVLARRGLATGAVLPVSLVLATFKDEYIDGLTVYRHSDTASSDTAHDARAQWLRFFATATIAAAGQAADLRDEVARLRQEWAERLAAHRVAKGRQRQLRSDSAAQQILHDLPSTPVLTVATVERIHGVSQNAAGRALTELEEAGVLRSRSAGMGRRAFVAFEVLDLITFAERQLASTRFDTRKSPPHLGVPAPPAV